MKKRERILQLEYQLHLMQDRAQRAEAHQRATEARYQALARKHRQSWAKRREQWEREYEARMRYVASRSKASEGSPNV